MFSLNIYSLLDQPIQFVLAKTRTEADCLDRSSSMSVRRQDTSDGRDEYVLNGDDGAFVNDCCNDDDAAAAEDVGGGTCGCPLLTPLSPIDSVLGSRRPGSVG